MRHLPLFVLAVLLLLSTRAYCQPEFDTTLASTGKLAINWGATASTRDLVVQPDKKIILASPCFGINFGSRPFCMVRLNENGSLDSSFGGNGSPQGTVATNAASTGGTGIAIQNGSGLVLVGGGTNLVLVRYDLNGNIDPTFGNAGFVSTTVDAGADHRSPAVAIQPDGKIVVVGSTLNGATSQRFIARYLPNGTLDASFGNSGIARASIAATGISVAVQFDGKILAGGASSGSYQLSRVNPDGSPDTSWDGDGVVTIPYAASAVSEEGFRSLAARPDGKVVALGHGNVIYRFHPDGSLDTSFDGDGFRPAFTGGGEDPRDLVVTAGGRITVVGGHTVTQGSGRVSYLYRVARYLSNGLPDPSFSDDGYIEFPIEGSLNNGALAAGVDPIGRVVIGGRSSSCCTQDPF